MHKHTWVSFRLMLHITHSPCLLVCPEVVKPPDRTRFYMKMCHKTSADGHTHRHTHTHTHTHTHKLGCWSSLRGIHVLSLCLFFSLMFLTCFADHAFSCPWGGTSLLASILMGVLISLNPWFCPHLSAVWEMWNSSMGTFHQAKNNTHNKPLQVMYPKARFHIATNKIIYS